MPIPGHICSSLLSQIEHLCILVSKFEVFATWSLCFWKFVPWHQFGAHTVASTGPYFQSDFQDQLKAFLGTSAVVRNTQTLGIWKCRPFHRMKPPRNHVFWRVVATRNRLLKASESHSLWPPLTVGTVICLPSIRKWHVFFVLHGEDMPLLYNDRRPAFFKDADSSPTKKPRRFWRFDDAKEQGSLACLGCRRGAAPSIPPEHCWVVLWAPRMATIHWDDVKCHWGKHNKANSYLAHLVTRSRCTTDATDGSRRTAPKSGRSRRKEHLQLDSDSNCFYSWDYRCHSHPF